LTGAVDWLIVIEVVEDFKGRLYDEIAVGGNVFRWLLVES